MLTNWRDQADLIIWSVWDSPVFTVISRHILLRSVSFPIRVDTGRMALTQAVKSWSSNAVPSSFRLGYPRERSVGSSFGSHAFARLDAATAPALEDARLKSWIH